MADPLIMASVLAVDFVGDQLNVTFGPVDSVHGGKMGGGELLERHGRITHVPAVARWPNQPYGIGPAWLWLTHKSPLWFWAAP